jgi:hypothetical protein
VISIIDIPAYRAPPGACQTLWGPVWPTGRPVYWHPWESLAPHVRLHRDHFVQALREKQFVVPPTPQTSTEAILTSTLSCVRVGKPITLAKSVGEGLSPSDETTQRRIHPSLTAFHSLRGQAVMMRQMAYATGRQPAMFAKPPIQHSSVHS